MREGRELGANQGEGQKPQNLNNSIRIDREKNRLETKNTQRLKYILTSKEE